MVTNRPRFEVEQFDDDLFIASDYLRLDTAIGETAEEALLNLIVLTEDLDQENLTNNEISAIL